MGTENTFNYPFIFSIKNLENVLCLCVPSSEPKDTTTEKNDYVGEWTEDLHDLTDDRNEETIHIERKKQWNPLTNVREYSYEDMMDLQSRLMLVSGKTDSGRESIERFTAVSYMFNNCKCLLAISSLSLQG